MLRLWRTEVSWRAFVALTWAMVVYHVFWRGVAVGALAMTRFVHCVSWVHGSLLRLLAWVVRKLPTERPF